MVFIRAQLWLNSQHAERWKKGSDHWRGNHGTDDLVRREADGLRVTPLGRLFVRIIAMRFDAYIQTEQRKGRYSQTV